MTAPEFRLWDGKISGYLSLTLAVLSLGAVLCFHFPALLTTPMLREIYPVEVLRKILAACLIISFVLGALSFALNQHRLHGVVAMALAVAANLLGGARVEVVGPVAKSSYLGLDWFILDLLILALLFVPLERFFARLPEQRIFRFGWKTDIVYFLVTHLLVQLTVLVTMAPAMMLFRWAVSEPLHRFVSSQPLWAQFLEAILVADLTQYWVHRTFHRVPWLWRFHAIHHSSREMDWLMGSRLHIVDILVTRSLSFIPLYLLGFAKEALDAYLVFVAFQTVFIHANVKQRFGALRWIVATPQFHHWHHASEPEAIDKNFAVHLPILDIVFGTAYLPGRWPKAYGIEGEAMPEGFLTQLREPFIHRV